MKKIALSILSLFILLGGLFVTACDKKVVLSMDPVYEQIEIYTNDEDAENYQTKVVKVSVENSSAGIDVDFIAGEGRVYMLEEEPFSNGQGDWFFTIVADKSGDAKVVVYAHDDHSQFREISVSVKTCLERVSINGDDNIEGSTRFAIKGGSKKLVADDYFDLHPFSANDAELEWFIFDTSLANANDAKFKEFKVGETLQAYIDAENILHVETGATVSTLTLLAQYKRDESICEQVELDVLSNSTIQTLKLDATDEIKLGNPVLYENGAPNGAKPIETVVELKRNTSAKSSIRGELTVNTQYKVEFLPKVYAYTKKEVGGEDRTILADNPLTDAEFQKYFTFDIIDAIPVENQDQIKYTFKIDARDAGFGEKCFGDFCFFFEVKYVGYKHSISSRDDSVYLFANIDYTATEIEVNNEDGINLAGGAPVDVYSSYSDGDGFLIKPLVIPNDVVIDNDTYKIQIEVNQQALQNAGLTHVSQFLQIKRFGQALAFENVPATSTFRTVQNIQSGTALYLLANNGAENSILENIKISFVSNANSSAKADLMLNLYKITSGEALDVEKAVYSDELHKYEFVMQDETTYVSSSVYAENAEFVLKIDGLSSTAGLSLKDSQNGRFDFDDELEFLNYQTASTDGYIIVRFDVSLLGYNFEDTTEFWFEHVTGKVSDKFEIQAFVPLANASISTADGSNSSVYVNQKLNQTYEKVEGNVVETLNADETLSKIVVEAGLALPVNVNYGGATLKANGIKFAYLSFADYAKYFDGNDDDATEEQLALAKANFVNFGAEQLAGLVSLYEKFGVDGIANLFSVEDGVLFVRDLEFVCFVRVEWTGYDEEHKEKTLVRFFAVESLYAVRTLASNVVTKELFTAETLSQADMKRSYVDVTISLRYDRKTPTYSGYDAGNELHDYSRFTFTSANMGDEVWNGGVTTALKNDWYMLSNFSFVNAGRALKFRITANSTQLAQRIKDTLTISYQDHNGIKKETFIELSIKNVERVESVQWLNKTGDETELYDGEIYLNATSALTDKSQRDFVVSLAVSPITANDAGVEKRYFSFGNEELIVEPSASGTEFLVSIGQSTRGGFGVLYFLPKDMIKIYDSVESVLVYKYTRVNGELKEEAKYVELSNLENEYQNIIAGQSYEDLMGANVDETKAYSSFFINNAGQVISYKDVIRRIKVTVADGESKETAIRVYNSQDLTTLNYSHHYKVMNDLSFSSWKTLDATEFLGSIVGKDENITLTFRNNSETLIGRIGESGSLENMIFAGEVYANASVMADDKTAVGFVANVNYGTIKNVSIDVHYDSAIGEYASSKLINNTMADYVGGVVGFNGKTLENVYSYGASIETYGLYVGGIAGGNTGNIVSAGVEFYNFIEKNDANSDGDFDDPDEVYEIVNSIYVRAVGGTSDRSVGGLVGYVNGGKIQKSYVYTYPFENVFAKTVGSVVVGDESKDGISNAYGGNVASFVGIASNASITNVSECFAFFGNVPSATSTPTYVSIKDSYITYYDAGQQLKTILIDHNGASTTYAQGADMSGLSLHEEVWELDEIDASVNFGWAHLKNVAQSVKVDAEDLSLKDVVSPNLKMLAGKSDAGAVADAGILFVYAPTASVVAGSAEYSNLQNLNTISISQMFEGLSAKEARSLLVNAETRSMILSANSLQMVESDIGGFTLTVHSKMDFTKKKSFEFIIMNTIPTLKTTVDGLEIKNGQNVLVQKSKSRSVAYNTINSVYLNGNAYALPKDEYGIDFAQSERKVGQDGAIGFVNEDGENEKAVEVIKSSSSLMIKGKVAHEENYYSSIESSMFAKEINSRAKEVEIDVYDYADNAIRMYMERNFNVSVYEGATSLMIINAKTLEVKPSQYAVFDVELVSDNADDDLVFGLKYGEIDIVGDKNADGLITFDVDGKLSLELSWLETAKEGEKTTYKVTVKVENDKKHLVEKDYNDLTIFVNADSQQDNEQYLKSIGLKVVVETVEDVKFSTYAIGGRQIKNSVLYFNSSDVVLNTIAPSSDAILSVAVSPQYAKMSHFRLTYSLSTTGKSGKLGTVTISKLSVHTLYGYYVDSNNVSFLSNGLEVAVTEKDRKEENGVYYFRIYVSSAFETSANLKFNVEFFDKDQDDALIGASHDLKVDFMPDASVKVNGASTTLLAKGESATVSIALANDQTLYDMHLQNNGSNIMLTSAVYNEELSKSSGANVWTATLTAYVTAKVKVKEDDGAETLADSGIFYVVASVSRVINGQLEIKESMATICLVDFSIDADGIFVKSNNTQEVYQGKSYDVFYSYVNATDTLAFNYPILPKEYDYDPNNADEIDAVNDLQEKRANFMIDNNYADENTGYYINYEYDEETASYNPLDLKHQLWYAQSEESSTRICNGYENDNIVPNSLFSIDEESVIGADGNPVPGKTILRLTGERAGMQLMKLQTIVVYRGIEFVYDYYFLVVVDLWTDEDAPTMIETGAEFVDYLKNSQKADDYILRNDIVLNEYEPLNTDKVLSLDGNGYTIHLNSFKIPTTGSSLELALFNSVHEQTTLKNVTVNIYNGGQIYANVAQFSSVTVAGFALENNGVIYNSQVVAYYDANYQKSRVNGDVGLVVKYTNGENSAPIKMSASNAIESSIAGFVVKNNASVTNCRVGGEEFKRIVKLAGNTYVSNESLGVFVIEGQNQVAGFVETNSGDVSASFADKVQIYNNLDAPTSKTAGFVLVNDGSVQTSYVEADGDFVAGDKMTARKTRTNISSMGYVAGFVYSNASLVKNCYANIAIENEESKSYLASGFVYINESGAKVELCYSACDIQKKDVSEMQFSGVDAFADSLNDGEIVLSYYFNQDLTEVGINKAEFSSGALPVESIINNEKNLYGFSFSSGADAYDGIWRITEQEGLTLVSANQVALSNRYAVTAEGSSITSFFYNRNILDVEDMQMVDLSYGSEYNPIIIRSAYDFAMATGKASDKKEISSYKEYYNDNEVFGYYRLVNDIDMAEIDQNAEGDGSVSLRTTSKTFKGVFDGNGFIIQNISLGSSKDCVNYGLFAKMKDAVVMSLDLTVESIHNTQAKIVGTLAGTAVDTRFIAVHVTPVLQTGEEESTSVQGNNIVGGLVGMVFGDSKLHDISIENIEIYSSYFDKSKKIGSNDAFTGGNLREKVNAGVDDGVGDLVKNLSYAGGVVGYVDAYDASTIAGKQVAFTTTLEVEDYHLVTINVKDSVNLYAEIVGGLFGYVGNATLIYDANLKIDADMGLVNPSYIASKNLYAGGLIGENYGALFAVTASYSDKLQAKIEEGEHDYYSANSGVERGQQSIFSYTEQDQGFNNKDGNKPLFIGGLVGYMGGGYIHIGYSKLNVISHSLNTIAVGGVVGFAGVNSEKYKLTNAKDTPEVNVYLREVYASGDVAVDVAPELLIGQTDRAYKGIASGIVGAIEQNEKNSKTNAVALGLEKVLAVNYYSVNGNNLLGDVNPLAFDDNAIISDKHFMLVGKVIQTESEEGKSEKDVVSNVDALGTNLYIINASAGASSVLDMNKEQTNVDTKIGSATVGGYNKVALGKSGKEVKLKNFGMEVALFDKLNAQARVDAEKPENAGKKEELLNKNHYLDSEHIAQVESIGSASMSTVSARYSTMYGYFLERDWTYEYWIHEQDVLFPEIELTPKVNVLFWDVFNTAEVLKTMNQPEFAGMVIVRGKLYDDDSALYKDIDLTASAVSNYNATYEPDIDLAHLTINNFKGTLISYYNYSGVKTEGVSVEVENGGSLGKEPGIILDRPLFKDAQGIEVVGVTFYFVNSNAGAMAAGVMPVAEEPSSTPRLIEGSVSKSVLRDLAFVYNGKIGLSGAKGSYDGGDSQFATGGLVADTASATSFMNIDFVLRAEADADEADIILDAGEVDGGVDSVALGLLVGVACQNVASIQVVIEGVSLKRDNDDNAPIKIEFSVGDGGAHEYYFGMYAGIIEKTTGATGSRGKITIGLSTIRNVEMKISGDDDGSITDVYWGGFVGKLANVDAVELKEAEGGNATQGLDMVQTMEVGKLTAGLGFGAVEGATFNIQSVGGSSKLKGKLYQEGASAKSRYSKIGGIAGDINAVVNLSSFVVDFSVGGSKDSSEVFEENLYDYKEEVSPYVGQGEIGSFFGYASADVKLTGDIASEGTFELSNGSGQEFSVGGLVGIAQSNLLVGVSAVNNMNISVQGQGFANVGGIVGKTVVAGSLSIGSANGVGAVALANEGMFYQYNGTVLSSVKKLNFGGAVGSVASSGNLNIANYIFGGAVKIFGELDGGTSTLDGMNVSVGGVVGSFEDDVNPISSISNCMSYGDVFVNYLPNADGTYLNEKLSSYNFGGIVGSGVLASDKLSVEGCVSLMTSFNDRLTTDAVYYNAGAIAGKNAGAIKFNTVDESKMNYYNSGVSLCIQEESGCVDVAYTDEEDGVGAYEGYLNGSTSTNSSLLGVNGKANAFILGEGFELESGSKLNPVIYTGHDATPTEYDVVTTDGAHTIKGSGGLSNSNGILWMTLTKDITIKKQIADSFVDVAFVGNGWSVDMDWTPGAIDAVSANAESYGGLVNRMGLSTNNLVSNNDKPTFNILAGLKLNLNVNVDINEESESTDLFGGVTGATFGHSIIYGVGVRGKMSVGGKNQAMQLGGIVGRMATGKMEECYQDIDTTYRGSENGIVAGIANVTNYNTLIKSCYSAGQIETYLANNNYLLVNSTKNQYNTQNQVLDCYSVTQVKFNVDGGAKDFTNGEIVSSRIYDASELSPKSYKDDTTNTQDNVLNSDEDGDDGLSTWRFNRCLNYGYASHNFGYLSNVTTYSESGGVYSEVDYDAVKDGAIDDSWYFSVPSAVKFADMLETLEDNGNPLKYFIRYDFDISSISDEIGKNVGDSGDTSKLVFDGNSKTLDIGGQAWNKALFNDVYGTIKNLRLANVKVTGASGTLANGVFGTLEDITVIGSLISGTEKVGGVVGYLQGNATKVDSLVNVTATNGAKFIGGVAGELNGGSISLSSNAGQIIDEGTSGDGGTSVSSAEGANVNIDSCVGGIVGYSTGEVVKSYNSNAVMSNFTNNNGSDIDVVVGGIVGKTSASVKNCYNTGYVGAGNYSAPGYSFAGGIVGYAEAGQISGCINDATVESLGLAPNNHSNSGYNVAFAKTEDPGGKNHAYELKIYYGDYTYVNAFGVGYLNGATNSGSTSSKNIFVDGSVKVNDDICIYQTFVNGDDDNTRKKIAALQNFGNYTVDSGSSLWVNGVDSYGMPLRGYTIETLTRTFNPYDDNDLSLASAGKYESKRATYNAIWEKSNEGVLQVVEAASENYKDKKTVLYKQEGVWLYNGDGYDYHGSNYADKSVMVNGEKNGSWSSSGVADYGIRAWLFGDTDRWNSYYRSGNTDYVSYDGNYIGKIGAPLYGWAGNSALQFNAADLDEVTTQSIQYAVPVQGEANFSGYDGEIAKKCGLLTNAGGSCSGDVVSDLNSALEAISSEKKTEANSTWFTVNGEYYSLVKNKDNYSGTTQPYKYTYEVTFDDVADIDNVSWNKNFKVVLREGGSAQSWKLKNFAKNEDGSIKITLEIGASGTIDVGDISVELRQTVNLSDFELFRNNITLVSGTTWKLCVDDSSIVGKWNELDSGLKEKGLGMYFYKSTDPNINSGTTKISSDSINVVDGKMYITFSNVAILENASTLKYDKVQLYSYAGFVESQNVDATLTVSSAGQTKTIGVDTDSWAETLIFTEEIKTDKNVSALASWASNELNLSTVQTGLASSKIAFGVDGQFGVNYDGSAWNLVKWNGSNWEDATSVAVGNAEMSLVGSTLTVSGTDAETFKTTISNLQISYFTGAVNRNKALPTGKTAMVIELGNGIQLQTPPADNITAPEDFEGGSFAGSSLGDEKYQSIENVAVSETNTFGANFYTANVTYLFSTKTTENIIIENVGAVSQFVTLSHFDASAGSTQVIYNDTLTAGEESAKSGISLGNGDKLTLAGCGTTITYSELADLPGALNSSNSLNIIGGKIDLAVVGGAYNGTTVTATTSIATTTTTWNKTNSIEKLYIGEEGGEEVRSFVESVIGYSATVNNNNLQSISFTIQKNDLKEDGNGYVTEVVKGNPVVYTYFNYSFDHDDDESTSTINEQFDYEGKSYYNVGGEWKDVGGTTLPVSAPSYDSATKIFSYDGKSIKAFAIASNATAESVQFYECENGLSFKAEGTKTTTGIVLDEENVFAEYDIRYFGTTANGVYENTYTVPFDNFEYKQNGGSVWKSAENGDTITLSDASTTFGKVYEFEKVTFNAQYHVTRNDGVEAFPNYDAETESARDVAGLGISTIILADDIYGLDTQTSATQDILGKGYFVDFYSNGNALFTTNDKTIKDLNVVGMVSLGSASSGDYSLMTRANAGTISNITVFGNVRNVANEDLLGSPVQPTVRSAIVGSGTLNNVSSYIMVNGVNAVGAGNSVSAKIEDTNSAIDNHNILIAGHGANGENSATGNGSNGGDGGTVSASGAYGSKIRSRGGRGGHGGYGANGGIYCFNEAFWRWETVSIKSRTESSACAAGNHGNSGSGTVWLINRNVISNEAGVNGISRDKALHHIKKRVGAQTISYNLVGSSGSGIVWKDAKRTRPNDEKDRYGKDGYEYTAIAYGYGLEIPLYKRFDSVSNCLYGDEKNGMTKVGTWLSNIRSQLSHRNNHMSAGQYYINFKITIHEEPFWRWGVSSSKLVIYAPCPSALLSAELSVAVEGQGVPDF